MMGQFLEAEDLNSQIYAADQQYTTLRDQALCWLRLDRWDRGLEIVEKWWALQQRYSNFSKTHDSLSCFFISLSASVHALHRATKRVRTSFLNLPQMRAVFEPITDD